MITFIYMIYLGKQMMLSITGQTHVSFFTNFVLKRMCLIYMEFVTCIVDIKFLYLSIPPIGDIEIAMSIE